MVHTMITMNRLNEKTRITLTSADDIEAYP